MAGVIAIASYASVSLANDKSSTETTAYCIGAHQHDIEGLKVGISNGSKQKKATIKDLELQKQQKEVELTQAIKRKVIEYVVAARITEDGYEDSKLCSQIDKCTSQTTVRIENYADQVSGATKDCRKQFELACERRKRCD
jgi:hypothetical protein